MTRTCRNLLAAAAYTAVVLAALFTALTAFAQDTVAMPPPGAVPTLPPGLPQWATTLLTIFFTMAPIIGFIWKLVAPLIEAHTAKTGAAHTFMVVGELAASVVAEVEVRIKPLWAKANEDGTVSADEAAEIKKAAVAMFWELAPIYLKKALGELFGDESAVKAYVGGLLERANAAQSTPSVP